MGKTHRKLVDTSVEAVRTCRWKCGSRVFMAEVLKQRYATFETGRTDGPADPAYVRADSLRYSIIDFVGRLQQEAIEQAF
jgi:hypothetical protein